MIAPVLYEKKRHSLILLSHFQFKRPKKSAYDDFVVLPEGEEAHWEVAERILFVYAKLNPGQGYVQGMNEILGPIYYTMASDADDDTQGTPLYSSDL